MAFPAPFHHSFLRQYIMINLFKILVCLEVSHIGFIPECDQFENEIAKAPYVNTASRYSPLCKYFGGQPAEHTFKLAIDPTAAKESCSQLGYFIWYSIVQRTYNCQNLLF
jgi:hypothetical protein